VVLRGLVWYGLCKAWTSWRGSARCGAVILGQSWQCEVWHGFYGEVRYGKARRN